MQTTEKTCKSCGINFCGTEFYKHPTTSDGLQPKCKSCLKISVTERRKATGYAAQRKYEKSAKGIAARFAHDKARMTLHYAIRKGDVVPLPCMVCGNKAEAHHPDYSRPLDVVWLCPPHHKQAHALVKKEAA